MDPLTITASTTSVIKVVSSVSWSLYTFINEARNVDQNVRDLATEVNALKRVLLEVDPVLNQASIASTEQRTSTDESKQLRSTLYACLEECQITVARLDSALDGVRAKQSNWMRQALRQAKLNMGKEEINSFRIQIHTHCISFTAALQMLNIHATYSAPGVVIDDLGPKINGLQQSLNLMMASLKDLKNSTSHTTTNVAQFESPSTKKLHSLGDRILAKATTVYASSVGGGSVYGEPVSPEALLRTMNWIPEPTFDHRTSLTSLTSLSTRDQPESSGAHSSTDIAASYQHLSLEEADVADSDSDGEFEVEVAQGLFEKGKMSYESKDYKAAVGFLQTSVMRFNRLPHGRRTQLDMAEAPLMIATCKFHLKDIDEASNDLVVLLQKESSSDQDAIRKCQISHLLSQISLVNNDVAAAENYCRNTLKGRRRMLGKTHKDYFASLALLSEIYLVRGKSEEAAVFKDMLPAEHAQSEEMTLLKDLMQARQKTQTTSESVKKKPVPPAPPQNRDTLAPPIRSPKSASKAIRFGPEGQKWKGHGGWVNVVTFSPDSSLLASGSGDNTVKIWNSKTGQETQQLEDNSDWVRALLFSPDGSILVSGSDDAKIRLWDLNTGRVVQKLEGHTGWARALAYSPNGALLASGSADKTVRLWDPNSGRELQNLANHKGTVTGVVFVPDGLSLASSCYDTRVRLWDLRNEKVVDNRECSEPIGAMAMSPDGSLLAAAAHDCKVWLFDLRTNLKASKLEGHTDRLYGVDFSPSGSTIASASDDNTVRLWDVRMNREIQKLEAHSEPVNGVAFSPDGSLLASASRDRTIALWTARDE